MALTAHNVKDNWYAALDGAINASVTSLVIDGAGAGAEPTAPFYFNIDSEQLLCTAVATNTPTSGKSTLTVTRAQNGTTGASHSDNAAVQQLINAAQITELNSAVDAIEAGTTVDKDWCVDLTAANGGLYPRTATGSSCGGPTSRTIGSQEHVTLDFDQTSIEYAAFACLLPSDYDGSQLAFDLLWTCTSGSAGNQVKWQVAPASRGDDGALNNTLGGPGTATDAVLATNDVHKVTANVTPDGATVGYLYGWVRRDPTGETGGLAADALLLGMRVRYA